MTTLKRISQKTVILAAETILLVQSIYVQETDPIVRADAMSGDK